MGGRTYVISIPCEYVKKYGLRKGDELSFEEKGSEIVFKNQKARTSDIAKIEIRESDNLDLVLKSLYERGYDEIELTIDGICTSALEKALALLPGFEISSFSINKCTIKCISSINSEEFENMLKRLFFMMRSIPESINIDKKETVAKINNARRLSLLCKRCLSKKEFGDYGRTLVYYSLLNEIEATINWYNELLKEKSIPFGEISKAAEMAYDALYKKDNILEEVKLNTKNSPKLALVKMGLSKIAIIAQGLKTF